MRNTQIININKDSALIFKAIKPCEVKKEYKEHLEKETGCKCIILQDIELEKILNKKELLEDEIENEDIDEIETTNMYASGKLLETIIKYKYKEDNNIDCERNIYSCGLDEGDKDYQVISYYKNGELIKENIECLNDK